MKLDKTSKYVFDILNVNFEVMTFSEKQVKTLKLVTNGRCCFCAAYPDRKMYLEIRSANEGAFNHKLMFEIYSRTPQ